MLGEAAMAMVRRMNIPPLSTSRADDDAEIALNDRKGRWVFRKKCIFAQIKKIGRYETTYCIPFF